MKTESMIYLSYGIYVDWQISENLIPGLLVSEDVNGINSYENWITLKKWQIVITEVNGSLCLSFDVDLPYYAFFQWIQYDATIYAENLTCAEMISMLLDLSQTQDIPILDLCTFYLDTGIETQLLDWKNARKKILLEKHCEPTSPSLILQTCEIFQ